MLAWRLPVSITLSIVFCGCGSGSRPVEEVSTPPDQIPAAPKISTDPQTTWPVWRGPNGNNFANCTSAPVEWSPSQNILWKAEVPGRGHSSPCVVAGSIYLTTADDKAEKQSVLCFSESTGQLMWQTEVHSGGFAKAGQMHPNSTHANATVACDGSSLFVGFLNNEKIYATSLDLQGKIRWQKELGFFQSRFGFAASPCLHDSLAIFAADNEGGAFIAAVHRETGDVVWRKARNNVSSYSSAIVGTVGPGLHQLLISGDNRVAGYDPLTGEELWSCPGTTEATCGTMVWKDSLVFASGGYPEKQTICVDASTGQKVWSDRTKCYEQSMLIAGDWLYAVTDEGIAVCRHAATGKTAWRERLQGPVSASPLLVGDNIYATNERGSTWVFKATPDGYQEVARNQLGSIAFASMVACNNRLYARVATGDRGSWHETLYCIGDE
jgi:outer membrane protein assembly factor BamB